MSRTSTQRSHVLLHMQRASEVADRLFMSAVHMEKKTDSWPLPTFLCYSSSICPIAPCVWTAASVPLALTSTNNLEQTKVFGHGSHITWNQPDTFSVSHSCVNVTKTQSQKNRISSLVWSSNRQEPEADWATKVCFGQVGSNDEKGDYDLSVNAIVCFVLPTEMVLQVGRTDH